MFSHETPFALKIFQVEHSCELFSPLFFFLYILAFLYWNKGKMTSYHDDIRRSTLKRTELFLKNIHITTKIWKDDNKCTGNRKAKCFQSALAPGTCSRVSVKVSSSSSADCWQRCSADLSRAWKYITSWSKIFSKEHRFRGTLIWKLLFTLCV